MSLEAKVGQREEFVQCQLACRLVLEVFLDEVARAACEQTVAGRNGGKTGGSGGGEGGHQGEELAHEQLGPALGVAQQQHLGTTLHTHTHRTCTTQ